VLARVIKVFGAAHPNHAHLFTNRRSNRLKVLVHDDLDYGWQHGVYTRAALSDHAVQSIILWNSPLSNSMR
jgi:hypothetical protein